MAEVFTRANIGPDDYTIDTWTNIHEVKSNIVGSMLIYFSATNISGDESGLPKQSITVNARVIDKEGKIVQIIIPNKNVEAEYISLESTKKIVMKPGDILQVKANAKGIVFYSSILTGLRMY